MDSKPSRNPSSLLKSAVAAAPLLGKADTGESVIHDLRASQEGESLMFGKVAGSFDLMLWLYRLSTAWIST